MLEPTLLWEQEFGAGMVAPYPTIGEVNKRAAGAYFTPRLFESDMVKRVVGLVQRFVP